jgi:integrase/recombinase XerD
MATAYQKFYEVIADNQATTTAYVLYLNKFLDYSKIDAESLAKLGVKEIEDLVFNYIISLKEKTRKHGKPSPNSYNSMISPIKLFCNMNDKILNWVKFAKYYPERVPVANQMPYTREDIVSILEALNNKRDKAFVHLLASSGIRIGAISSLNMEDVKWIEDGAIITIYRDDIREYRVCLTPEATTALKDYLATRLNTKPKDALFTVRNNSRRLTNQTTREMIDAVRQRIGSKNSRNSPKGKSANHAFRKRMEITLANAGVHVKYLHYLTDHNLDSQDRHYFRGMTDEDVWKEFKKAIPHLTIDQTEKMSRKLETEKEELSQHYEVVYKKKIEDLELQQMNDKEKMYDLIMTMLDNPKKAKEMLAKRE